MRKYLFLLTIGCHLLCGGVNAQTKGLLLYSDHMGAIPEAIEFEAISWKSASDGFAKIPGATMPFKNNLVAGIVYFQRAYFEGIDGSSALAPMRTSLRDREIAVDIDPQNIESTEDADRAARDLANLDTVRKKFPSSVSKLSFRRDVLRQQLDRYRGGERKRSGQWMRAADIAKLSAADQHAPVAQISFTTNAGAHYDNVRVTAVDQDTFTFTHAGGVARLRFDELPKDIAQLPEPIRAVAERRRVDVARAKEVEANRIAQAAEEKTLAKSQPTPSDPTTEKSAHTGGVGTMAVDAGHHQESLAGTTSSPSETHEKKRESLEAIRERSVQELELHKKDSASTQVRLEANSAGKLVVKGLFIGMQLDDCYVAIEPHAGKGLYIARAGEDILNIYLGARKGIAGQIFANKATKEVTWIHFSRPLCNYLFGSSDMNLKEFAQTFIDNYDIPELNPSVWRGEQTLFHDDDDEGSTIRITDRRDLYIYKSVERKFGD